MIRTQGFDISLTNIMYIPDTEFILLPFFFFLALGDYPDSILQPFYILLQRAKNSAVLQNPPQYSLNVPDC